MRSCSLVQDEIALQLRLLIKIFKGLLSDCLNVKSLNFISLHIRNDLKNGSRLIFKIKSGNILEEEIHEDFAKIYRRYKLRNKSKVGEAFFEATHDILDKLCDNFEKVVLG